MKRNGIRALADEEGIVTSKGGNDALLWPRRRKVAAQTGKHVSPRRRKFEDEGPV